MKKKTESPYSAHGNCEANLPSVAPAALHNSPLMEKLQLGNVIPPKTYTGLLRFLPEEFGSISVTDNRNIESGWTYFGQFMAHDLTMHREFSNDRPYLRLHSLYGAGPKANGFLYEFRDRALGVDSYDFRGVKFALDSYKASDGTNVTDVLRLRRHQGLDVPLMADIRNDENFVLSQLHCLFLKFHNQVAEYLHSTSQNLQKSKEQLFKETRQVVTWTYQYILLNEYLPKLLKDKSLAALTLNNFKIIDLKAYPKPFLTPEFIVAALRTGHSQVRQFYKVNEKNADLELYSLSTKKKPDLKGFKQDMRRFAVDWSLFFDTGGGPVQFSRKIDLLISTSLGGLPFMPQGQQNLGHTNLTRSGEHGLLLPKTELGRLASLCGITTIQDMDAALDSFFKNAPAPTQAWVRDSVKPVEVWPLWAFILLEAQILGSEPIAGSRNVQQTLGPLGSQIFAEQLLWILRTDDDAYLKTSPDWIPTQVLRNYAPVKQRFGMVDVIAIAENGIPPISSIVSHSITSTMTNRAAVAAPPPDDPRNITFSRRVSIDNFNGMKSDCSSSTTRSSILLGYANDNISTVMYAAMWREVFGTGFPLSTSDAVGVNLIWYVDGGDIKLSPLPFDAEGQPVGNYEAPSDRGAVRNWLSNASPSTISAQSFSFTAAEVAAWLQISGSVPSASATFVLVALEAADAEGTRRFTLGIELNSSEAAWGRPCPPFCYP